MDFHNKNINFILSIAELTNICNLIFSHLLGCTFYIPLLYITFASKSLMILFLRLKTLECENTSMSVQLSQTQRNMDQRLTEIELQIGCDSDQARILFFTLIDIDKHMIRHGDGLVTI